MVPQTRVVHISLQNLALCRCRDIGTLVGGSDMEQVLSTIAAFGILTLPGLCLVRAIRRP
jgi:hypothetical protein